MCTARDIEGQPEIAGDLPRVYVPSGLADTLTVIDQRSKKVLSTFRPGRNPQHVVPSYDLRTLWILNNNSVVPITAATGSLGRPIAVSDPYNLYFTLDGQSAIVVAERFARLDFRDPHTMKPQSSLAVRGCSEINHAEFSVDGRYMIVTCEFAGRSRRPTCCGARLSAYSRWRPCSHRSRSHDHDGHATRHPAGSRRQALLRRGHGRRWAPHPRCPRDHTQPRRHLAVRYRHRPVAARHMGRGGGVGTLRTRLIVVLAALSVTGGFAGCEGGGRCQPSKATYENGRTYIQQRNFCDLMHNQGVPCRVPPPPSC